MIVKPIFSVFSVAFLCGIAFISGSAQTISPKVVGAQNQEHDSKKTEETYINHLIYAARSQTPEIAADALITVAESGRITRLELKRQLLEEAFSLASQAKYPVRIRYMGYTDTPTFLLYTPLEFKLDRLALQSRVVHVFIKFDKVRAKKLFLNEMPPEIDLPAMGCEDAIRYYDVSDYYETASAVFAQAFTAKERRDPAFLYTILPFIERMTSPAQVEPLAKMLSGLQLDKTQLAMAITYFSQALRKIQSDDFTFRQSIANYEGIRDLSLALDEAKIGNQLPIITAFREYVLKQLNGTRCSDGVKRDMSKPLESVYIVPAYIQALNSSILKEKPIISEEIDPEKILKASRPSYYWDSQKSSDRLERFRKLRFKGENEISLEEKQKAEWRSELDKCLIELGMWESDEENTKEDFINKKSIVFLGLLNRTVPRGPAWDAVLKEYVLFLDRNELRDEGRLQWFWLIRTLLREIVEPAKPDERAKMLDLIKSFKNPTIDLYCDLMLLQTPPNSHPRRRALRQNDL